MSTRTQYTPSAACFKRITAALAPIERPVTYRAIIAALTDESVYNPTRAVREYIMWLHDEDKHAMLRAVALACAEEASQLRSACRAYVGGRELLDRECRDRWPNFTPMYPDEEVL